MTSESLKKSLIILLVGLLAVSAFFIRLQNFKNNKYVEIDENVYYSMAKQVVEDGPSGYHTIPYGEHLAAKGRPLPEYFFQPLFKHPPVFTFLVALSMKLFGVNPVSAEYVSLSLSILMIPLIYLLGAQLFSKSAGALSAIFLWMDPISIACSQRIWADSTIAFFTLLSATFFIMGIKQKKDWFFILSGIGSGLAANTKYTGIFITFAIALYGLFCKRELFKNKKFQLSLVLPFLMLVPWFCWNLKVYGIASVPRHSELKHVYSKIITNLPISIFLVFVFCVLLIAAKYYKRKNCDKEGNILYQKRGWNFNKYSNILIPLGFFILIVPKQFLHSLQFTYLPTHSLGHGLFSGEPPTFYFGRLLEFSPLYIFSFWKFFTYDRSEVRETMFIRLSALVIVLFFIFWGNYQSRYILSCVPFFIILGVKLWVDFYAKLSRNKNIIIWAGRMGLNLALVYIALKSYYLNVMVSFPNNMAYF